ncbi:hypothetical protein MT340_009120 [Staphylococcus sp. NRL 16/872]|nr:MULTISPECIES: hypothetical protein [unclassified Staphylococcus]MCJ1668552.1 hypothetical protein [Staphylococcus sp. NRL 19/737]WEN68767.1 hypothetical protein MT340_009120 [Staphylococcus sp. NRL 16/872]
MWGTTTLLLAILCFIQFMAQCEQKDEIRTLKSHNKMLSEIIEHNRKR